MHIVKEHALTCPHASVLAPARSLRLSLLFTVICCFVLSWFASSLCAQSRHIFVDGRFDDWDNLAALHSDPLGDPNGGSLDFGRLWVTSDDDFLFLRVEVTGETVLQRVDNVVMYLDTDNNPATGLSFHGIGAELRWSFQSSATQLRTFFSNGNGFPIVHNQIGLVAAPTVSSTQFEIVLRRDARPIGQTPLFPGDDIRIVFQDAGPGGDFLPDQPGGVLYHFDNDPLTPLEQTSIAPLPGNTIRFLSYNILNDGLFDASRLPSFTRILQALQPQIIGLEEVDRNNHTAQEVADRIESILPSAPGEQWFGARVQSDIFAVSRFPVSAVFGIQGVSSNQDNGAFLLDLRPQFDSDLLLVVAHPPCCDNDAGRQFEVDAIMAFIRDAITPGGLLSLTPGTPILIMGDMNLVGAAQQLTTLLTGQIINTGTFGQPFVPDWDGSDFADLTPRLTNLPLFYTWYSEGNSFSPGRLDYMIFSNSVLQPLRQLVLFTPMLPADTLAAHNLLAQDVLIASDHLPVVGDFQLLNLTGITGSDDPLPERFSLEQNFPNPFNPETQVRFRISQPGLVRLTVYDLLGREVRTLLNEPLAPGEHQVVWDGKDALSRPAASGVYIYRLVLERSGGGGAGRALTRKMLLLR